ncbi:MAG TPA: pentapeptide repeat-containing protein [Coleofasciculaceae cyanobacterium]|jgi:uncharacterized protein YjbI with pentapeptide repeats
MNKQTPTNTSSQDQEIINPHTNQLEAHSERIGLSQLNLPGADLSGANFKGRDLSHSQLAGAQLRNTNFQGANLSAVNFEKANLQYACLVRSRLECANLEQADVRNADLRKAQLTQACLSGSILNYSTLAEANLTGANLEGASLLETNLTGACLRGAILKGANLAYTELEEADLSNADLSYANLAHCELKNTNLSGACLENTILSGGLNHCQKVYNNQKISNWQGMRFRSQSEIKLAQALEERGLLYFPNSLARLGNYHKSFEVDFLVCCPTRWGFKCAVLEVDGYWHLPQKRAKEHERERLFEHSGVRVHRFDASLCEHDPHAVVSELLDLINI